MNVPNILTVFRILLTPLFIYLLFNDFLFSNFFALVVFVLASITDAYDGYYARKYNVETEIGNFLDPLADKILVSSAFISSVFYLLFFDLLSSMFHLLSFIFYLLLSSICYLLSCVLVFVLRSSIFSHLLSFIVYLVCWPYIF